MKVEIYYNFVNFEWFITILSTLNLNISTTISVKKVLSTVPKSVKHEDYDIHIKFMQKSILFLSILSKFYPLLEFKFWPLNFFKKKLSDQNFFWCLLNTTPKYGDLPTRTQYLFWCLNSVPGNMILDPIPVQYMLSIHHIIN